MTEELLKEELYIENYSTGEIDKTNNLKIVGIKYDDNTNYYDYTKFYFSNKVLDTIKFNINMRYSKMEVLFLNKIYESTESDTNFKVVPNKKVPDKSAYISDDLSISCNKNNCLNETLEISVKNLYYNEKIELKVTKTYTKKNIKNLLTIKITMVAFI